MQQAHALQAVAGSAPEELSTDTRTTVVSFCSELAQTIREDDTGTAALLLSTAVSLSRHATVTAAMQLHSSTASNGGRRAQGQGNTVAQELYYAIDQVVQGFVPVLLNRTTTVEVPMSVVVRFRCSIVLQCFRFRCSSV